MRCDDYGYATRHRWGIPRSRSLRPLNERPSIVGRHIFLACLLVGAVIARIILFTAEYGGVKKTGYSATIERIFPVGSARSTVGVEVTNLGSSEQYAERVPDAMLGGGLPHCRLQRAPKVRRLRPFSLR